MKYLSLESYNDFRCVGGDCPLTCCGGGWRIMIDSQMDAYYQTVGGEFGEILNRGIHREAGSAFFELDAKGDCAFLDSERLCKIYKELGEEHLCNTCTVYPRIFFQAGDIWFSLTTISCPEIAERILAKRDSLKVDFGEDSKSNFRGNEVDWELFNQPVRVFAEGIGLLQNRAMDVRKRAIEVLSLTNRFQEKVDVSFNQIEKVQLFVANDTENSCGEVDGSQRDFSSKIQICGLILLKVSQIVGLYKSPIVPPIDADTGHIWRHHG